MFDCFRGKLSLNQHSNIPPKQLQKEKYYSRTTSHPAPCNCNHMQTSRWGQLYIFFKHQHLFMWCCSTCPSPEPWLWRSSTVDWLVSMIKQMCPLLARVNIWWAAVDEECWTNRNRFKQTSPFSQLPLITSINLTWIQSMNVALHECRKEKKKYIKLAVDVF